MIQTVCFDKNSQKFIHKTGKINVQSSSAPEQLGRHHGTVTIFLHYIHPCKYDKNHHISAPPIHTFFKLHQHNVPQKITFFMNIYDCENKNTVQSEKLEKSQF